MLLIKNGHLIDPKAGIGGKKDILISNGRISEVRGSISPDKAKVIDAGGKLVMPAFIDMHAHLRQPGREDAETVLSGSMAAAKGGFTTVLAMPNTDPVADNQGVIEFVKSEGDKAGIVDVYPVGAITKGLLGENLSNMSELKSAGAIAISDDGKTVVNSWLARKAFEYAKMIGLIVISHCEDRTLSGGAVMNEGYMSTLLGLSGSPCEAESNIIAREIELASLTGARVHIAHVSCKRSVELIREAKKKGVLITCETAPHYFSFTDRDIKGYNTNFKVNPPLRGADDVEAVKKGLADGTIDVIATDHAPHTEADKDVEFDESPFGMIGLETALGAAVTELVDGKVLDWNGLVTKLSARPAEILGIEKGSIASGMPADVVIIDPNAEWTLKREDIVSKSKNS
ncbi:MAG: dihydroorotase, partial [Candidatus Omnitrophica bacterium CG1_02_49_10]